MRHSAVSLKEKWLSSGNLLTDYSANFVAPNYQSFFLMSKRVFKSFGKVEAVRIDMEVSNQNSSYTLLFLAFSVGIQEK